MSNNFNSDSLESFFQKGLQDDLLTDIASDGWDMPSDAVWDNIETGITVRQIRGKKWGDNKPWLSVAAAILFITIFYQTLSQQQSIDGLQHQIDAQANKQTQIDNNQKTKQSEDFQNNIASIPTEESTSSQASTTSNTNNIIAATTKNTTSITTRNIHNNSVTLPSSQNILFDESQNRPLENQNHSLAVNPKLELTAAAKPSNHTNYLSTKLEKQQLVALNVKSKRMTDIIPTLKNSSYPSLGSVEPFEKAVDQKNVYVGAYIGSNWTSTKVKGNTEVKDLLDKQQFTTSSYQTGVKIGYQLSDKWSVETGLAYNKIQQKSEHQLNFTFDSDDISLNADGEYEGTYTGSLSTSYGSLPVDVVLSHGSIAPNLQEGQILPFKLKSKQTLEMVQVPVAVRYAVGSGRLKLHLSAGATANILTNKDLRIALPLEGSNLPGVANVSYEGSDLQGENYLDDINNLSFSLTAGAELTYALTNNLHLYAAPTYSKGVTPVYESEELETDLSQATVLLGINYFF